MDSKLSLEKNRVFILSLIGLVILFLGVLLFSFLQNKQGGVSVKKLRCVTSQQVTPFGDRLLYYDGSTLFCLSANGTEQWKYALGEDAGFSVGDRIVCCWVGSQLHILDRNGRASYNDRLADNILFARAGKQYVAVILGLPMSPGLVVKDINGMAVDSESLAYKDKFLLNMGFFENGNYLWTTSLDVYGVSPSTILNIYRVGAMNTGTVDLGEDITYNVLYSAEKLHVISTREMNLYNYQGTIFPDSKQLVYGWQLIDSSPGNKEAIMLFAPVLQTSEENRITELRVLTSNKKDKRYTLLDECVGAGLMGDKLFAFSSSSLFQAGLNSQRFSMVKVPLDKPITGYIGKLSNNIALVSCDNEVYAIKLP